MRGRSSPTGHIASAQLKAGKNNHQVFLLLLVTSATLVVTMFAIRIKLSEDKLHRF